MYKKINRRSLALWLVFITLTLAGQLSANSASTTTTSEIRIKADHMVYDTKTGSNTYEGNVSIVQGSIELTGDTVTILRPNDQISDIKVTGTPARYIQDANTDNIVHAVSHRIHYSTRQNRLTLIDEASLEQADHTVKSQRIVYDTVKKVIIAGNDEPKDTDSKQRVNITLTPKKDTQKRPAEK